MKKERFNVGTTQQYLRACSSSGIAWVKTMASPPAAGDVAIPPRTALFECPVLLGAPTLKLNHNDRLGDGLGVGERSDVVEVADRVLS